MQKLQVYNYTLNTIGSREEKTKVIAGKPDWAGITASDIYRPTQPTIPPGW